MATATSITDGWRPETRYNTNVLVGNWQEDRQNWQKFHYPVASSHRIDFRDCSSQRPDKLLRLKEKMRLELGSSNVMMNYSQQPAGAKNAGSSYPYLVTWYDEDYNKKERTESERLPALRNWDLHHIAWLPEKSDHPISHPPTNWGLTEKRSKQWSAELRAEGQHPSFDTTYSTSYLENDVRSAAQMRRFAVPRDLSVHFVPNNRSGLLLRGRRSNGPLQLPQPPLCNIAEQIRATHCRVLEQGRRLQDQVNYGDEAVLPPHPQTR